ncbi:putative HTH cro/C1-type domain-containing protein [Gammaproteobacteria bacterium]
MNYCSATCQALLLRKETNVPEESNILIGMRRHSDKTAILAHNIQLLLDSQQVTIPELAKKSGISARMIHFILKKERTASIDIVEAIGNAFGFDGAHLLMADFKPEIVKGGRFDRLYHTYAEADETGRHLLEMQAEYMSTKKASANNPNVVNRLAG